MGNSVQSTLSTLGLAALCATSGTTARQVPGRMQAAISAVYPAGFLHFLPESSMRGLQQDNAPNFLDQVNCLAVQSAGFAGEGQEIALIGGGIRGNEDGTGAANPYLELSFTEDPNLNQFSCDPNWWTSGNQEAGFLVGADTVSGINEQFGCASRANLIPVNVRDTTCTPPSPIETIANAIKYVSAVKVNGVQRDKAVNSISLTGFGSNPGPCPAEIQAAINVAVEQQVAVMVDAMDAVFGQCSNVTKTLALNADGSVTSNGAGNPRIVQPSDADVSLAAGSPEAQFKSLGSSLFTGGYGHALVRNMVTSVVTLMQQANPSLSVEDRNAVLRFVNSDGTLDFLKAVECAKTLCVAAESAQPLSPVIPTMPSPVGVPVLAEPESAIIAPSITELAAAPMLVGIAPLPADVPAQVFENSPAPAVSAPSQAANATSPESQELEPDEEGTNTPVIAASVIGGIVLVGLAACATCCLRRRGQSEKEILRDENKDVRRDQTQQVQLAVEQKNLVQQVDKLTLKVDAHSEQLRNHAGQLLDLNNLRDGIRKDVEALNGMCLNPQNLDEQNAKIMEHVESISDSFYSLSIGSEDAVSEEAMGHTRSILRTLILDELEITDTGTVMAGSLMERMNQCEKILREQSAQIEDLKPGITIDDIPDIPDIPEMREFFLILLISTLSS